jgi:hypothetical protein
MDHTSIDITLVIDTFLLLLIGVGPKIALVPFLEVTAGIDPATKQVMVRKMLTTPGWSRFFSSSSVSCWPDCFISRPGRCRSRAGSSW